MLGRRCLPKAYGGWLYGPPKLVELNALLQTLHLQFSFFVGSGARRAVLTWVDGAPPLASMIRQALVFFSKLKIILMEKITVSQMLCWYLKETVVSSKSDKTRRKVQWNDRNGNKLVEIMEFEPSDVSDSDDVNDEDSCICIIISSNWSVPQRWFGCFAAPSTDENSWEQIKTMVNFLA
ncbi:Actin-related protein 2/3 complex subunit 2 [Hibiscus syriacus]|uniref:Actin-related protein 2/3 complex subunit 2 n=1 Tax=Hibiscus syriacus TaxID=106335 RepID=A0A6A3BFL0_HIBSY|nr:Actin-related protein 2/3 complex subunit 2 [Hibiscus syriacus]